MNPWDAGAPTGCGDTRIPAECEAHTALRGTLQPSEGQVGEGRAIRGNADAPKHFAH